MKSLTASCMFVAALISASPAFPADTAVATIVRPPALQQKLDAALIAKETTGFHPHTRHLLPNGRPRYINRLILEDSPYLLQHANNPVDWHPWGEEAFAKARRENKLVFLSIGYSTCHWCHVMERESFEDPAIARLMNANFVAIKVDRESRPDLDHLYMTAVTLLTGSGGWPMNSLLTPDGRTVFGGTYLPPADLTRLLQTAAKDWRAHPADLKAEATRVAQAVQQAMQTEARAAEIAPTLAGQAARLLLQGHDDLQGGFGHAPKFPNEPLLALLLDQAQRNGDARALAAVETDLADMDAGGIHDQVGGGFHRYSTDNEWLVPHFEKMLYNQAQLTRLYLAAYRLTGKAEYARVARRTLDFVLREMTAPDGGFYSALDADSAGGEGHYYLWTPAEVRAATRDAAWALQTYQITDAGNFDGSNIPHLSAPLADAARARLDRVDADLLAARQKRVHPHLDNKVLTGWNGLMITAFADAADTLREPRYLRAAERAAHFLWQHQRQNDGGLWRVSVNGRATTKGMLEDYAYLVEAFIALYDGTGDAHWLQRAGTLADAMHKRFWGEGGYYLSEADAGTPMARPRDASDGASPSANGVALHGLAALARRSGEARYEEQAQALLAALSGAIVRDPTAHVTLLTGMNRLRLGETGARQYAAHGAARVEAHLVARDTLNLNLHLQPGWHVNAEHPLQSYLIPTSVTVNSPGVRATRIDYPKPDIVKLGFQTDALALYQNDVRIVLHLSPATRPDATPIALELRLQACNDRTCLPPETLRLSVPAGAGAGI